MPKILMLSDLNWSPDSRKIEEADIAKFRVEKLFPKAEKFNRLKDYAAIILDAKPEMVLFAGDVTGDGSCGRGFHKAFLYLLNVLEISGIHALFIQGDHDEQRYIDYLEAATRGFSFVHHISGRAVQISGLTILGLSFFHTNFKPDLKNLVAATKGDFDILLCHCELKRRNWLFDLNCQYIVTGHFDHKCSLIRNKTLLSFGNDFTFISYALLDTADELSPLEYGLKSFEDTFFITFKIRNSENGFRYENLEIQCAGKSLDLEKIEDRQMLRKLQREHQFGLKAIQGNEFKTAVEKVFALKNNLQNNKQQWDRKHLHSLNKLRVNDRVKVSRSFVLDYLDELVS